MEASCLTLSIEGERLLKAHDYEGAIKFFEAGLRQGTDDLEVLSAVYNQLGNACYYLKRYEKALEYHKKDLEIAERQGDKQGMAKAYGNLGNTFKSLKNHESALKCCEQHLELTRQLRDRVGESRACYNLGNVHHDIGKRDLAAGQHRLNEANRQAKNHSAQQQLNREGQQLTQQGRVSVEKAIDYYKTALEITVSQKDKAGEGRAVGNLGNAYTAIGKYQEAITYHNRRLKLAEEANDLPARARACGNLGNAFSALADYTQALQYYNESLAVAREAGNEAGEGQAYYCLGSTYYLQKNYEKAIENHKKHLEVVTKLNDKQGQVRAWHNLRNAYAQRGDKAEERRYDELIKQQNPRQPRPVVQAAQPEQRTASGISGTSSGSGASGKKGAAKTKKGAGLFKKSAAKGNTVEAFSVEDSSDEEDVVTTRAEPGAAGGANKSDFASEWLASAVKESQQEMRERQSTQQATAHETSTSGQDASELPMDFFDMLVEKQRQLDDQRAPAPSNGMAHFDEPGSGPAQDEDAFFDMILETQANRYDTQRSAAAEPSAVERNVDPVNKGTASPSKTVGDELDDNMSFFEMLAVAKKNKA
ncbi:uncharacterized protein MONBRDRAFT_39276 [Monosiga brevicollis MX1]|uniref:Uncharacterized protein n=1 Tax=Monosiga brevicollis TaxID=81824 RepID=A9VDF3_MONBE|nr:uncharacterized protein MONBRDRAFT_39276 [Monosiga brevicollis MX1]EDQ84438.1 predicted protein [Monosiga brevicollis MX1]|eukprot:XP_001750733.1 hypothetical protein [Monosiga brevicollis MX1]